MKKALIKNTEDVHKCRSKVVMKFGQYWFQKMGSKEWDQKKNKCFVKVEDVHTDKELVEFMTKLMQIRMPRDTAPFLFYMIPDFKQGHGVVILKAHHSFTDGAGMG